MFQTALEFFGDEEEQVEKAQVSFIDGLFPSVLTLQAVFSAFARMETRLKEYERARVIYKVSCQIRQEDKADSQFALARLPRSKSATRKSPV